VTQERRVLEQRVAVRNTPMPSREWETLLDLDDTEAVEVDGGEMAIVARDGQLHLMFAFDSNEVMKAAFNPMWDALRPKLRRYRMPYLRCDLVSFPVREWIDHMLDEADFVPFAAWIEMEHRSPGDIVPPEAPAGVTIRRASAVDHDRICEIEAEAYGDCSDGVEVTRARLEQAAWAGVLEEDGVVIAYAVNGAPVDGVGRVLSAAVASDARGRGLGATVLQAAAYQLASAGVRRVMVLSRPDIPRSVETARAAGFRPGRSGSEFRRSLDEKANRARRHERHVQGMKVRFGEWR
jgi:ribosomal protein S18 acetylase RimI-like enzyme